MKFSVVIPVYNVGEYIRETVESLLKQKDDDFEIIAVNDGSTDNSLSILNEYADSIKIIDKPNGGLVSARITGILAATGDYVLNIDGDDLVSDDFAETIKRETNPNVDILVWQGQMFWSDGRTRAFDSVIKDKQFVKDEYENELYPVMIGGLSQHENLRNGIVFKAVKREILLDNLKYYTGEVKMGEDLLISTASILGSQSIKFIPNRLYLYRQSDIQMTSGYKKNLIGNEDVLIRQLLKITKDRNEQVLNKYIVLHALEMMKSAIFNEIKYGKDSADVRKTILEVFKSKSYEYFRKEHDNAVMTRREKMIWLLLKLKMKNTIVLAAKIYKKMYLSKNN